VPGSKDLLRRALPRPVRRGLYGAHLAAMRAQQRVFERRLGVSTSGHDYLEEGISDRFFYEGCQWLPVERALKRLDPGPADVFVDYGSGKGQALLIAGRLPYGRVLGIELGEQWHREAEANIARARRHLRSPDVRSICADVLEWEVPDDLSVVFLYSPFIGELFHAALERVFASYDRNPRPLHLVYDFPWEHDWLVRTGRVQVVDVAPAQWPPTPWWWRSSWVIVTYRVVGPGEGGGVPEAPRRLLRPARAVERWAGPNRHRFMLYRPGTEPLYSRPAEDEADGAPE
jgi:hypothetical protein